MLSRPYALATCDWPLTHSLLLHVAVIARPDRRQGCCSGARAQHLPMCRPHCLCFNAGKAGLPLPRTGKQRRLSSAPGRRPRTPDEPQSASPRAALGEPSGAQSPEMPRDIQRPHDTTCTYMHMLLQASGTGGQGQHVPMLQRMLSRT